MPYIEHAIPDSIACPLLGIDFGRGEDWPKSGIKCQNLMGIASFTGELGGEEKFSKYFKHIKKARRLWEERGGSK